MKKLILLSLIIFLGSCASHQHCAKTDAAKCEKTCEKKCETASSTKTCTKTCTKTETTKSCCKK